MRTLLTLTIDMHADCRMPSVSNEALLRLPSHDESREELSIVKYWQASEGVSHFQGTDMIWG